MFWKIKIENIMVIATIITVISNWIAFVIQMNVYTLALAVIPTFIAIFVIMSYGTIKELRQNVLKNWK